MDILVVTYKSRISAATMARFMQAGGVCSVLFIQSIKPRISCKESETQRFLPTNPLNQPGMVEEHTNKMINAIIKNKHLNISYLPDILERSIYKFAIGITYSTLLNWTSRMHGLTFLNHEIIIELDRAFDSEAFATRMASEVIDSSRFERMVDLMLASDKINMGLVPDFIERRIYTSCLIIIFQALQAYARTSSVNFSGHKLEFDFKVNNDWSPEKVMSEMVLNDDKIIEQLVIDHFSDANIAWLPDFIEKPFVRNLYAMVPALIEQVLGQAELKILGNSVKLKIRPSELQSSKSTSLSDKAESPNPSICSCGCCQGLTVSRAAAIGTLFGFMTWLALPRR